MKLKLILDAGHGWFTKGKDSLFFKILNGIFKSKPILKENNVNEAICNKMSVLHDNCKFITNEWQDVPLQERVNREHKEHIPSESLFMSIHADAYTKKDAASGATFFYYSEKGRNIAKYLTNYLRTAGYMIVLRTPKKANFMMLRETKSPSVLFELGFMTTKKDLDLLMSEDFRNHTSKLLIEAVNAMPKNYLL